MYSSRYQNVDSGPIPPVMPQGANALPAGAPVPSHPTQSSARHNPPPQNKNSGRANVQRQLVRAGGVQGTTIYPSGLSDNGKAVFDFFNQPDKKHAREHRRSLSEVLSYANGVNRFRHAQHAKTLDTDLCFMQWLFPTDEKSSANPTAPILTAHDCDALRGNSKVMEGLDKGFTKLLQFYGLKWDAQTGVSDGGPYAVGGEPQRGWAHTPSHHDCNLTRMIRSMHLFGQTAKARALLRYLENKVPNHPSMQFWRDALPLRSEPTTISSLPMEILTHITRFSIAGNDSIDEEVDKSAVQLIKLQRVNRQFYSAATDVLNSENLHAVRGEITFKKIVTLLEKRLPIDEFEVKLRELMHTVTDLSIRFDYIFFELPPKEKQCIWNVLAEKTNLRYLNLQTYVRDDEDGLSHEEENIEAFLTQLLDIVPNNTDLKYLSLGMRDEVFCEFVERIPYSIPLVSLNLGRNFDDEFGLNNRIQGVIALSNSPHLRSLTSLDLGDKEIGLEGVIALANSPNLKSLTRLNLYGNRIGGEGAKALANSPNLKSLSSLDLGYNEIGGEGAKAIANSPNLKSLTTLSFTYNHIGDEGVKALANSSNLKSLTTLILNSNQIVDEGVKALANSPYLKSLISLNLRANYIGAEGAKAIANSPYLRSLISLNFSCCNIGTEGAIALANSLNLKSLTSLYLGGSGINKIGDEGVKALANSPNLKSLTTLSLAYDHIGSEGAKAIADSPYLKSLTSLDLSCNPIGVQGATALANSPHLHPSIKQKYKPQCP